MVSLNAFANRPAMCDSEKNADLIGCAEHYHSLADKKLNEKYKELSQILSSADKALLKSSQRDWLKFRDAHCSEHDPNFGAQGVEAKIDFLSCKIRLTNARTFELQALLDDGSSDVYDNALSKISVLYAKKSTDLIKKEVVAAGKGDRFFDEYAKKNCELSASLSQEPEETCLSRVYFIGK